MSTLIHDHSKQQIRIDLPVYLIPVFRFRFHMLQSINLACKNRVRIYPHYYYRRSVSFGVAEKLLFFCKIYSVKIPFSSVALPSVEKYHLGYQALYLRFAWREKLLIETFPKMTAALRCLRHILVIVPWYFPSRTPAAVVVLEEVRNSSSCLSISTLTIALKRRSFSISETLYPA